MTKIKVICLSCNSRFEEDFEGIKHRCPNCGKCEVKKLFESD